MVFLITEDQMQLLEDSYLTEARLLDVLNCAVIDVVPAITVSPDKYVLVVDKEADLDYDYLNERASSIAGEPIIGPAVFIRQSEIDTTLVPISAEELNAISH